MKFVTLLTALTAAALAQDPAPEKKPVPEKAAEAPAANKPELKPAQADPQPAASELKPTPDLPALPDADVSKGQPGPHLKPPAETIPQLLPDNVPTNNKGPLVGGTSDRPKTKTTLKAPVTSGDLDLRIRYRQAENKAAAEPALLALWEKSRLARTDYAKREALKSYFDQLFKRMLVLDKGITPLVTDRSRYDVRRLVQSRIEPTDPIDVMEHQLDY